MTGVDLSPEFLTRARAQSAERGLAITWEERDMRDLPWPGAFDGAFCFGNSFAYLDDEGNAAFLQAVGRVLKPQARFAMNLGTVAESILPTLKESFWMEIGDLHFLIKNQYDHVAGRLESNLTLIRDGQVEKKAIAHRIYAYSELCRLLEAAGLGEIQGYASVQQELYRLGSPNLFLVATKRRE
jgi:SAM-dependent methyltransferase